MRFPLINSIVSALVLAAGVSSAAGQMGACCMPGDLCLDVEQSECRPCGDLDHDGDVDADDEAIFMAAMEGEYNPEADFNHDGVIDLADLAIFTDCKTAYEQGQAPYWIPDVTCAENPCAGVYCVPPGDDCWATQCDGQTFADFSENPIPADFFEPGSEPFEGQITLGGASGFIDTVLHRLNEMCFEPPDFAAQTPIELVQLDLVSCAPIDVAGSGLWDVQVAHSPMAQPGMLMATKTHANGGTFTADFYVQPVYTFTKVDDPGQVRIFDTGIEGIPPIHMQTTEEAPWSTLESFERCTMDGFAAGETVDEGGAPCCEEVCHSSFGTAPHEHCATPPECPPCPEPDCIPPGDDCWSTACDGKTKADFTDNPIPADFFEPGSEPFEGQITLGGASGFIDTILHRSGDLCFGDPLPATGNVPIELVQLGLVSCEPVDIGGSGLWDVAVGLSSTPTPAGLMTATKNDANGGTFTAEFYVQPVYTFTKVGDPSQVRVFDTGAEGIPPILMQTTEEAPWSTLETFEQCTMDGFAAGETVGDDGLPCCEEVCHSSFGTAPHEHCSTPPDCPPCPSNDDCEDAVLLSIPVTLIDSTTDASFDSAPFCDISNTAPGVWYKVVGTGNTITATTCSENTNYDTKLTVYTDGCDVLTCVAGNDDDSACVSSSLQSTVAWCSKPNQEYLILIHGYSGNVGDFELTITDDGVPCACIPPGQDCWSTQCGSETFANFSQDPIPADFFEPGSEPFDGQIALGGAGFIDTILQRAGELCFGDPLPATDFTPIDLTSLNLVSCQPITVGGSGDWDVQVGLSTVPAPPGTITVTKEHANGGTFTAEFYVQPRYLFTRVDPPNDTRILDTGEMGMTPILMHTDGTPPWSTLETFEQCTMDGFAAGETVGIDGTPCCVEVCHSSFGTAPHEHCTRPPECTPCPEPPENDDCENAIPIFDGDTDFDTTGATTDGPAHPDECQFDGQTYNDIWYTYVAERSCTLTVSTCNQASYDTDLVVYDGCDCTNLVLLGCNDDTTGCAGFTSIVQVPVYAGNCYLIRIGGYNDGSFGAGTVTLQCLCAGDMDCSGAVDFDDIDLFVEALGYPNGVGWPYDCPWMNGDCDGDMNVTFDDIDPFVARIGASCP